MTEQESMLTLLDNAISLIFPPDTDHRDISTRMTAFDKQYDIVVKYITDQQTYFANYGGRHWPSPLSVKFFDDIKMWFLTAMQGSDKSHEWATSEDALKKLKILRRQQWGLCKICGLAGGPPDPESYYQELVDPMIKALHRNTKKRTTAFSDEELWSWSLTKTAIHQRIDPKTNTLAPHEWSVPEAVEKINAMKLIDPKTGKILVTEPKRVRRKADKYIEKARLRTYLNAE